MWHLGLFITVTALVVVSITHWVYKWRNPKCNGNLPPGSMGWPLLGETLEFFSASRTWDTPPFIKDRIKRYGSVFRTSIVGLQVIVSTDPDLNYMVFQQEGKRFESWYPSSLTKIFGSQSLASLHGDLHKYLKNMVLTTVGPQSLKQMLLEVESVATRYLEKWDGEETVELKTACSDMIIDLMARKLISYDLEKSSENLRDNFEAFTKGVISFPVPIPGTAFYKCLQGRKKVIMMLKNMLDERRDKPNRVKHDFFDYVLEELKQDDTTLTEEMALDLMFALLFASYESTSQVIVVAIQLLTDNPQALKILTLINETLRLANILPGIFRKALTDIKFKDYTIPSGSVIMVCPAAVHLDPANYKDPLDFNPWRWEGMGFKGASKTFMAFGGGMRFCVGADLSRVQMAVFFHCLVTKYRWQLIKGGEIVRTPALQFPNGFHVQFIEKDKQNQDQTSKSA